jgi:ADP-heptose:LPS heptosyltransferase
MGRVKIAFVELWRLGDAVAATAGLRALRQARPDATIAAICHPVHGDPLRRSADSDLTIPFAAFWTRGKRARDKYLPWTIDYAAVARAWRALRQFRADVYLLFRGDIREQLFFSAIGAGQVVDLRWRLTLPGIATVPRTTGVPRHVEYVQAISAWANTDSHALPALAGVPAPIRRSTVVIHPGASWRYKQWRAENVAALDAALSAAGVDTLFVATDEDRPFLRAVEAARGRPLAVVFPTLDELYTIIARAAAIVCNNSAALHIAEAVGTPCVALTGSSDPVRWGTYRPGSRTICKSVGLPCHPCAEKHCVRPDHPCIDDISVADVIGALAEVGAINASPAGIFAGGATA